MTDVERTVGPGRGGKTDQPARPRTQEERSAATRKRLIDSAIACLVEVGYGETTTVAVVARAGLSRGAMLHHFPTREDLMRETGLEVARRSTAIAERHAKKLGAGESFGRFFEIAAAQSRTREFRAAAEFLTASRADPKVRAFFIALFVEGERWSTARWRSWAERAGIEDGPPLDSFLDLVAVTVSGLYLQAQLDDGPRKIEAALGQLRDIADRLPRREPE